MLYLIEILHQTTTPISVPALGGMLYLIEILHQTTTFFESQFYPSSLYLIEILHQTTTCIRCVLILLSCILSKFYIKPQQMRLSPSITWRCILSKFYIKPQLVSLCVKRFGVVSYRNSTSNHNVWLSKATLKRLYLIEILHQTTTGFGISMSKRCCILSKFYIKPQRFCIKLGI